LSVIEPSQTILSPFNGRKVFIAIYNLKFSK
jgi:hypothetical protein